MSSKPAAPPIAFSPLSLFAAGEQGVWFDPSDLSTLFQDSSGTTPVTTTGQSVLRVLDKSGRSNHATQVTEASAPTLQQDANGLYYLSFNGSSSNLATSAINFTSTDEMTVFAGARKASDSATGYIAELSTTISTNNGSWLLAAPSAGGTANFGFYAKGTGLGNVFATSQTAPVTRVLTGIADISGDVTTLRINGSVAATVATDLGTGNFGNHALYIGARSGPTRYFNGRLYSLVVRGASSSAEQISDTEGWINGKTGAY